MDLHAMIRELQAERDRLSAVIKNLESLIGSETATQPPQSRRGRKSMGAAERLQVSERMKKYWASRRKAMRAAGS